MSRYLELETEARRKEREQNQIPEGPRWLWDITWWIAIVGGGIGWVVLNHAQNHLGY